MTPSTEHTSAAQRRPSTIIDDTEPLLAAGGDSSLYKTISVRSFVLQQIPDLTIRSMKPGTTDHHRMDQTKTGTMRIEQPPRRKLQVSGSHSP